MTKNQSNYVVCGVCKRKFEKEDWRDKDGPCRSNTWTCITCIADGKCGCVASFQEHMGKVMGSPIKHA